MKDEAFLNRLCNDLNLSKEIKDINNRKKSNYISILKQKYYDKYVVKETNIRKYRDKEKIIKTQKETFDKWLDYLIDEATTFPIWAKYWVFQGMLKIGSYYESTGIYQKRGKNTLVPFIELNPEVIVKCIEVVSEQLNENELSDVELNQLIESNRFQELYIKLLIKNSKEKIVTSKPNNDNNVVKFETKSFNETPVYKKILK